MASTLPDDLIELLAESYSEINPATKKRWTLRELAAFASQQLGREVTRPVVERAIYPVRAEWAKVAREVARERIGAKLPAQLDALDDMIEAMKRDFIEAGTAGHRAAALDAYRKTLTVKLRFSGVGEHLEVSGGLALDGSLTVTDARSQLAAQLARAATGAVADAAGEGAGGAQPRGDGRPPP
jgi:hypothetical protein